eukprot:scaffold15562_cov144-Skeletonema_dohrnii-CCMP3373.AAC.3
MSTPISAPASRDWTTLYVFCHRLHEAILVTIFFTIFFTFHVMTAFIESSEKRQIILFIAPMIADWTVHLKPRNMAINLL